MINKKQTATEKELKSWVELAKQLNLSRPNLFKHRKKPGAPKTKHLGAWQKFLADVQIENGHFTLSETTLPETLPAGLDLGKLKLALLEARAGRERAERILKEMKVQRESDDWVLVSDAKESLNRILEPLSKLLTGLPKAWATRVNPADPDHAELILREAVDDLKTELQAGRGAKITKRKGVK
jgi:hypothetical protein